MRSFTHRSLVILAMMIIGICSLSKADDLARLDLPASWKQDAELTDAFFLNEQLGWAVGAQGVILRTVDGGKNWSMISTSPRAATESTNLTEKLRSMRPMNELEQLKSVRCRFESICFVDAKHGWVAGGFAYPCVDRSRSVLMTTADGGQTWKSVDGLVLPRIAKIRFQDRLTGWAIGDSSNLYQTGVYRTEDGGVTWTSFSSGHQKNWVEGELDGDKFVLLDENGQIFSVKAAGAEQAVILGADSQPKLNAIKMLGEGRGIAAGSAGTILLTNNDGLSWKQAPFDQNWLSHFDFRDIAIAGDKVWLVGDPGSVAISIDQKTSQIEKHLMPTSVSNNKVVFPSPDSVCAFGGLGSIVYSNDGGGNWQSVRGRERIAILNVFSTLNAAPLELLAKYSSEEGCVSANVFLNRNQMTWQRKLEQATERIGSSQCFELAMDQNAIPSLARTIRMMRPNVVTVGGGYESESIVMAAISAAADPQALPELTEMGLKPWQAERLAVADEQGELSIQKTRLLPRSGELIEDHIAVSRGLFALNIQSSSKASYRMTGLAAGTLPERADLIHGLERFGKTVPQRKEKGGRGNLVSIQHTAQKQKTMQALLESKVRNPQDALVWRKKVQSWIGILREETAGVWVVQLAQGYLNAGEPELAAQTVELLANRWPDHAFGPMAMTWLIRYYASAEFSRLGFEHAKTIHEQFAKANQATFGAKPLVVKSAGVTQTVWVPEEDIRGEDDDEVIQSLESDAYSFDLEQYIDGRQQMANLFLTRLRQRDPDLVLSPEHRLMETVLTRREGGFAAAENLLRNLAKNVVESPETSRAAKREIQIHESGEGLPPGTIRSFRANKRPFLDGKSDDEVWKNAIAEGYVVSRAVDGKLGPQTDSIVFSHDDEFVFVLVRCNKIKGQAYGATGDRTEADADVAGHDRIELSFDTDRDYGASMKFSVDHRGMAADSCAGCVGWNPDWYIARNETEQAWMIEMAIPLSELSFAPISGAMWAVSPRRRSFDSTDVWPTTQNQSVSAMQTRSESGLQQGLDSRASLFSLLKFE